MATETTEEVTDFHRHTAERWQEYKPVPGAKHVRYMRYMARCPGCGRVSGTPWSRVVVNQPKKEKK